jgi:hypothetical protein
MTKLSVRKQVVLGILAFSVALPAVPAFAERGDVREGHRVERQEPDRRQSEHWNHEREARKHWEHRDHPFAYRDPYAGWRCFTRGGYWTSDGWQRVWVPPQEVCR